METILIIFAMLGAVAFGVLHSWHVIVAYRVECQVAEAKRLQVEAMQARLRADYEAFIAWQP